MPTSPCEYHVTDENTKRRYVPADGILLITKAEVQGQAAKPGKPGKLEKLGTPAQPYDGKLNGYT